MPTTFFIFLLMSLLRATKREVIFEDFRQLENYLTRRYEGMGLGLAVARRTAQFLGGNIKLNVRDDGNTFEIILPINGLEDPA